MGVGKGQTLSSELKVAWGPGQDGAAPEPTIQAPPPPRARPMRCAESDPRAHPPCLWDVSPTFPSSSSVLSPDSTTSELCLALSHLQPLHLLFQCPPCP